VPAGTPPPSGARTQARRQLRSVMDAGSVYTAPTEAAAKEPLVEFFAAWRDRRRPDHAVPAEAPDGLHL
jgi:hypothetical protein